MWCWSGRFLSLFLRFEAFLILQVITRGSLKDFLSWIYLWCSWLIDESIISVFNIIFESVLFIFDFVLFNIIFFLELFYFNFKLFNVRNKYSKDSVLEQKKGIWSWFVPKIWRSYTKISCAKNLKILHQNIKLARPILSFCCFCFFDKLPILVFLT